MAPAAIQGHDGIGNKEGQSSMTEGARVSGDHGTILPDLYFLYPDFHINKLLIIYNFLLYATKSNPN